MMPPHALHAFADELGLTLEVSSDSTTTVALRAVHDHDVLATARATRRASHFDRGEVTDACADDIVSQLAVIVAFAQHIAQHRRRPS